MDCAIWNPSCDLRHDPAYVLLNRSAVLQSTIPFSFAHRTLPDGRTPQFLSGVHARGEDCTCLRVNRIRRHSNGNPCPGKFVSPRLLSRRGFRSPSPPSVQRIRRIPPLREVRPNMDADSRRRFARIHPSNKNAAILRPRGIAAHALAVR